MRSMMLAAALAVPLALAACSKTSVDEKNVSVETVAKKVADSDLHFTPGRWETTMKFEKLDMGPNMPPQAKDMFERMTGKVRSVSSCLTKEEAAKPEPKFFGGQSKECTYEHFTMGGGKIDAKMACKRGTGPQDMTMTGNYTPESYDMTVQTSGAPMQGMKMDVTMTMASKRVGECTGKEDG
ncbi:DUF3617 domain-containing protein [Novosphingobium lentum]|uniref:DUF3617 domain-containing protein n=1 Tax=Novosphingobium lentum TaxID=145287 RepID=UPI000A6F0F1B|nr:DUF3617 domain-containing protein [Novosphingobium lentum]